MAGYRDDAAGDYGTWSNDPDQSWLDWLKMKGSDVGTGAMNALSNISGAMSPIGTSPQGNMALQIPPLASSLASSVSNLVGSPAHYWPDDEPANRGGRTPSPRHLAYHPEVVGSMYSMVGNQEIDKPIQDDANNFLTSFYGGNAVAAMNPLRGGASKGVNIADHAIGKYMDYAHPDTPLPMPAMRRTDWSTWLHWDEGDFQAMKGANDAPSQWIPRHEEDWLNLQMQHPALMDDSLRAANAKDARANFNVVDGDLLSDTGKPSIFGSAVAGAGDQHLSGSLGAFARSGGYDVSRVSRMANEQIEALKDSPWKSDIDRVAEYRSLLSTIDNNPNILEETKRIINDRELAEQRKRKSLQTTNPIAEFDGYKVHRRDDPYVSSVTYDLMSEDGSSVGTAMLGGIGKNVEPEIEWVSINKDHQRKGLATKLYDEIERDIGKKLWPSQQLITPEIVSFWEKRDPQRFAAMRDGLYSLNAAFDPARAGDNGLLLSDTGKPSIFGSAVAGAGEQPKGINAYHGSPHDFDKFSLDKIGTGEGAQAYGHGLYFADNEAVAKSYRDQLAATKTSQQELNAIVDGQELSRGDKSFLKRVADAKWNHREQHDYGQLIDEYTNLFGPPDNIDAVKKAAGALPKGRMYQVRINADPEHFLDWDKPIAHQSEAVKNALSKIGFSPVERRYRAFDEDGNNIEINPRTEYRYMGTKEEAEAALPRSFFKTKGRVEVDPEASRGIESIKGYEDRLREAGVPGIRYLDGNSRGSGSGSSNYVVFDDSLIEIMKKYGLAGGAVGAGALAQPDNASAQDIPDWIKF